MMELEIAKKYGNKIIRKAEKDARQSTSVKRKAKKVKVVKNKFHRQLIQEQQEANFFSKISQFLGLSSSEKNESIQTKIQMHIKKNRQTEDSSLEQPSKQRIRYLWYLARQYDKELRKQSRQQRKLDKLIVNQIIDEINDDQDPEHEAKNKGTKIKWYLLDSQGTFCFLWNLGVTFLVIYTLIIGPYVLVFQESYVGNTQLVQIEYVIDIIFCFEIIMNFLKRSNAYRDIKAIGNHYIKGYFLIDCIATIPGLYTGQSIEYYWLKMIRICHIHRLTQPQQLILEFMLQNLSKKRQGDLTVFAGLILGVVYTNHINACFWLYLGH